MANKASEFAENLSVIANVTALTLTSLQKIGRNEDVEINAASRDLIVSRIQSRLAYNLRIKDAVQ